MLLAPARDNGYWMKWAVGISALGLLACGLLFAVRRSGDRKTAANAVPTSTAQPKSKASSVSLTALSFEPNQGQSDRRVKFLSRNARYNLFLTNSEAVFVLNGPSAPTVDHAEPFAKSARHRVTGKPGVLRMQLAGAQTKSIDASSSIAGHSNYFIGSDPSKWVRNVPQFTRVSYVDVYPGIDMAFYGNEGAFEFDLNLSPKADPKQIRLRFSGARQVRTNANGDLVLTSSLGDLALHKPFAYQEVDGKRKPVDVSFVAHRENEFGISVGAYDPARELVIDPSVLFSTYLGGSAADLGQAIAADSTGVYVTGETSSSDFPGATSTSLKGTTDAFVTKFTSDGSALIYSTYLGGANQQGGGSVGPTASGNAIVIDASGNAYISGGTNTSDFPICQSSPCPAPAQSLYGGGKDDAFVVKLNSTGSLAYSSFIGGNDVDVAEGIAIDSSGNMYIGGETASTNLPVFQAANPLQGSLKGEDDGFIAKINGTSGSFMFLDYLGGSNLDTVSGIALDSSNNIYVGGITSSTDFPIKGANPYQPKCGDAAGDCSPGQNGVQSDAFFTAIKSDLSQYIYSTYFGGTGSDGANGIVVDASGDAYIAGFTSSSTGITTTANAFQQNLRGSADHNAFVAELDPTGSTAKYVTYIGGGTADAALNLALDSNGRVYLTGQTISPDFPTKAPTQIALAGMSDAFVSLLDPSKSGGAQLVFSTFIGGPLAEDTQLAGIAIDPSANIYVTGDTASPQSSLPPFPIVNAFQPNLNGSQDAFVTKISSTVTPPLNFTLDVSALTPDTIKGGASGTATVTVTSNNGFNGAVSLKCLVQPSTAVPPSCSFSPVTVTVPSNGTITSTLTIGTTAPSGSVVGIGHIAAWLPLLGLALLTPGLRAGRKRSSWFWLAACALFAALLLMPGCVSGSGPSGGGSGGTTTGNYHFTVSGGSFGANATATSQTFTVQ